MLKVAVHINYKIFKKKKFWATVLVAQFLLFYIFSKVDFIIKFFERFFDFQKPIHQKIFSIFFILVFGSLKINVQLCTPKRRENEKRKG